MTAKKLVILSHLNHRGEDCIRIDFRFDNEIKEIVRSISLAMWSQKHKCWYFKYDKDILNTLVENLERISAVEYYATGQTVDLDRIKDQNTFLANPFSEFSSIFISYSFIDRLFVNRLNDSLLKNGVNTFLWEKDAPIGETLKDIMFENVHKYDRVLFVASENSLKSQACHYELTQAREKQDKLWKTILFPIHIDNFLFKVRKENIRPRDKADEYWMNISELRDINSLDFTEPSVILDNEKFDEKINKLLINLEIE